MRNDYLLVTTQGIRGGRQHVNKQGMTRLSVTKAFNAPMNSIEIDVFSGTSGNYKPREEALINVTFADGKQWTGTFADLQKRLTDEG